MSSRPLILLGALLGLLILGALVWRNRSSLAQSNQTPAVSVDKQPVNFANRTFDANNPPTDMPPLTTGEEAECDSKFLSEASVAGQTQQTDATHAFVTITQIKVALRLEITIWAPAGASQHVIEHEQGHRQISEHYYQNADEAARQIATKHMGQQVEVTGADLNAESNKLLQQVATEITNEYNRELNPEPTQLLYDRITDHGRNEVVTNEAVAAAIKNVAIESLGSRPTPGN